MWFVTNLKMFIDFGQITLEDVVVVVCKSNKLWKAGNKKACKKCHITINNCLNRSVQVTMHSVSFIRH